MLPAKKVFRWISRRRRATFAFVSMWVCCGVTMNFIPRPRMAFAAVGAILCGVKSWKARLVRAGSVEWAGRFALSLVAF